MVYVVPQRIILVQMEAPKKGYTNVLKIDLKCPENVLKST
jgi:hypothetical protein